MTFKDCRKLLQNCRGLAHKRLDINLALLLCFLLVSPFSIAQSTIYQVCDNAGHTDVFVEINPPATDGAQIIALSQSRDLFFPKTENGTLIVPANVRDAPGGPNRTDDPGWVVNPGDLLGVLDIRETNPDAVVGEFLWFRGRGSLRYWDPELDLWFDRPPAGERVRYFAGSIGGLNLSEEEADAFSEGTVWTADGLQGQLEAPIEEARGTSLGTAEIHAHLNFCLEDAEGDCTVETADLAGNPTVGGYLIEFELFSTAVTEVGNLTQQKYLDSLPIQVLISNGLTPEDCDKAVVALVEPEKVVDDSPAQPAAGILIMSGP